MRSPIREPLSYFRYLGKNKAELPARKFVFRLRIYIFKLEIYVFSLEICISRLEMQISCTKPCLFMDLMEKYVSFLFMQPLVLFLILPSLRGQGCGN